jgi:hypothetical protein
MTVLVARANAAAADTKLLFIGDPPSGHVWRETTLSCLGYPAENSTKP